ncbi:MAG: hypothetical protein RIQ81_1295 [Pseudomonadota bacterium]|jgi:hypothetical protein
MTLTLVILALARMILAACIPLGNDEVYYWDWGRAPRLSYFDHPPGVSWLSAAANTIFNPEVIPWAGALQARGIVPAVHLAASLILFRVYVMLGEGRRNKSSDLSFLALTQLTPAFGLGGFFLLPDAGLILFSTAGIWFSLKLAKEKREPTIPDAILAGAIAGAAGLFKYHAAPVFAGMYLALAVIVWPRFSSNIRALIFTAIVIITGFLATLPVWVWNANNSWISLLFQSGRGFSDAQLDLPRALRTVVGEMLLLSPGFFAALVLAIPDLLRHRTRKSCRVVLWSTIPLLGILHLTATYKEVLPHWSMPAIWLLIPHAALLCGTRWSRRKVLANVAIAAATSTALITITAVPPIRKAAIAGMKGHPGPLGELTFWPDFVAEGHVQTLELDGTRDLASRHNLPANCGDGPVWASFRWYTTAHMAWSFPGQPHVLSFEDRTRYYYADRDRMLAMSGCPVIAISESGHAHREVADQWMTIAAEGDIELANYQDRKLKWFAGYLR